MATTMHIRLLQAVAGRLLAEGVKDSSDEELERCLSGCAAASRCLDAARRIRQLPGDWTTNLDTLARSAE